MSTTDPRHRAWDDIQNLLPEGWQVGPPSYDPGRVMRLPPHNAHADRAEAQL